MAEQIVSPDLNFVKEVIAAGADSLKKCYQCSTCTVVCEVTPNNKPFPRKEMLYAQWGMKDQLITNPDIWPAINAATALPSVREAPSPAKCSVRLEGGDKGVFGDRVSWQN